MPAAQPFNLIVDDPGARRAMHVDAEQVSYQTVVLDRRALGGLLEENSGIHRLEITARSADSNAADSNVGRSDRDDVALATAIEHRARASIQHQRSIDPDRTIVFARSKLDDVALTRAVQQRLQ